MGVSDFNDCEFQESVQESALFTGARFLKEGYFYRSKFTAHTDFRLVEFKENTYFSDATFLGPVGFAETIFRKDADFRKVTFNGDYGNFRATEFFGEFISFRNAKFRNLCDQQ